MHVLIAPDKFKGSLTAREVADAIEIAVRHRWRDSTTKLLPLADGGDGTLDALCSSNPCRLIDVEVTGPLGSPVTAPVARLGDGRHFVEAATASGLVLVPEGRARPLDASTRGVGELIDAAARTSRAGISVGVGGTASTDGGTGAATACGWRFLDSRGHPLPPGGGALVDLARVDGDDAGPMPEVTAACDVTNPLLGPHGAAAVFAPQKGAGPEQVQILEEGLARLADRIANDLGLDVADLERAGAGGGLAAGLRAFFGAELAGGFELVAAAAGFEGAVGEADLVVTGEGRLDRQSLGGKVAAGVAAAARSAGIACVAVAGEVTLSRDELSGMGIRHASALVDVVGRQRAFEEASNSVVRATADLLTRLGS